MQEKAGVRDEVQLAAPEQETQQRPQETRRERYASGEPPAHGTASSGAKSSRTASEMAFDEYGNARELKDKISAMVSEQFGGNYQLAFAHYDCDQDGGIDKESLIRLLSDAGIGNPTTRGAWANGVLDKLDRDGDEKIQWWEFEQVIRKPVPVAPKPDEQAGAEKQSS